MSVYMIMDGEGHELTDGIGTRDEAIQIAQRKANERNSSVYYHERWVGDPDECPENLPTDDTEVTPRRYVISHYESGIWIVDGRANSHGETTAELPDEVYDLLEQDMEKGETLEAAVDGVRYQVEAE